VSWKAEVSTLIVLSSSSCVEGLLGLVGSKRRTSGWGVMGKSSLYVVSVMACLSS
jgi:hypothetical protein